MDSQAFPAIQQAVQELRYHAAALLVYQSVLEDEVGQAWLHLLSTLAHGECIASLTAYGKWFRCLADRQSSWQEHLLRRILEADNPLTRQLQQRSLDALPQVLADAARQDLMRLQRLYQDGSDRLSQWVQTVAGLEQPPVVDRGLQSPTFTLSAPAVIKMADRLEAIAHWEDALELLAQHYQQTGVGIFARYHALRWQGGDLVGIAYPDPVHLDELVGYEIPKTMLIQNTEALLQGYRALHVLLYGSRGTGKSSLVKGLLSAYGNQGLRLIEVAKSDLKDLTTIVDTLRHQPQKFIIFVDDLSFEEDEDTYKALKVVLEGNLTARPQNIVVYATSNRRHLIREFFGDRPRPSESDEVHAWDTVQEKLSFSDRFGLTLTFEPADQTTYLEIVHHLAQRAGINLEPKELEFRALQWATRHNGRSGRTARQFVDFLQAELARLA
jgi:predicted AAA+ superfamily ATPase